MLGLVEIDLQDNNISYLGPLPDLPSIHIIKLKNNRLESLGINFMNAGEEDYKNYTDFNKM